MKSDKRILAGDLFVKDGKDVAALLAMGLGSKNTIGKWRKEDRWDERRAKWKRTKVSMEEVLGGVLEAKVRELEGMATEEINPGVIDALYKLIKSIEGIKKEGDPLVEAMNVMEGLAKAMEREGATEGERECVVGWMEKYVGGLM